MITAARLPNYIERFSKTWIVTLLMLAVWLAVSTPALAQVVSWQAVDINSPGTAGSFTYNGGVTPPTYTVSGAGTGISSTDKLDFTNVVTAGNVEIEGQLSSQSSATTGATAGLMIRDSLDYNAATYAIGLTVGSGITFNYRPRNAGLTTVTVASITAPVYLRLVRSGDTVSGYYSTDDETWILVGSNTQTSIMPNQFYIGFTAFSTTTSLNTAVFNYLTYATSVPQLSSNLLLWLRGDVGVVSAAGAVSQWTDQSGNSNHATQSTGTLKPTLTTGAINNGVLPALTFNGTSQYLSMPSDFANMTAGASLFIILKPTSASATCNPISVGNAANSDAIFAQTIGTQASLSVYNGATSSSVTTTNNPLSNSSYQLLEETLLPGASAGTATGTIYVNGTQDKQATNLQNPTNISRTKNYIGTGIGLSNYFQGSIAEVLLYSNPLTASQRASMESYFLSKYGIGAQPTLDAPTFSTGNSITAPGQTVSISQSQGATNWFTTNGATPTNTPSSQWFNITPIQIFGNVTLKAMGVMPFFTNSPVATATYQFDPLTSAVPRNGLSLWLRADSGVTTSSGKISQWLDESGSGNNATQGTGANQPTLVANAINGLPAASFNGSSTFLQLPAGMANLTSGASVFIVTKPSAVVAGARFFDFGNGATADNIYMSEPTNTGASLFAYNGAGVTSVTSASAITLGQYQLLEAVHNGAAKATIYTNSVQGNQNASMNNLNNLTRSNNFIGQGAATGNFFNGQIAEMLFYSRGVTASEQAAIEAYLFSRYQLLLANTTPTPVISVAAGTLTTPTQVAIEAPAAAVINFTVDGTTPTGSSPIYTGPINVAYTQTVKAIATINGVASTVASAAYTLDSTKWPAPGSTTTPLQLNLQLPGVSIPQDSNQH